MLIARPSRAPMPIMHLLSSCNASQCTSLCMHVEGEKHGAPNSTSAPTCISSLTPKHSHHLACIDRRTCHQCCTHRDHSPAIPKMGYEYSSRARIVSVVTSPYAMKNQKAPCIYTKAHTCDYHDDQSELALFMHSYDYILQCVHIDRLSVDHG